MDLILALIFFLLALLYGSVGLGGASGYIAAMGLLELDPAVIRPTALTMNVLVASIGTWKHVRAGQFSGRIFWPIVAASIPMAFIGGRLTLPGSIYRPLVGLILQYAAWRLWRGSRAANEDKEITALPIWMALLAGGLIGLTAGLIGIGGGILLGPLILLAGWAKTRDALGITSAFVLATSLSGLLGRLSSVPQLPPAIWIWLLAVGIGGWIGAEFGSKRLNPQILRRLLALVLVAGGLRMLVG